ncbi:hypothetical protein [Halopseudomonas pelagia]|uniref:hypothetical protein n=1 Tax=Halopseudomonas pelagia TaxID=553151 RepID=UPI0003B77642|nr:hypothetical protein [Halopseudomonas pelagia]|tara:strand:- start:21637 stop:22335 length:699 start_codon:yes stop_codon:yes gene_type:complete
MADSSIGIVDAAKGLARNPLGIIALFIVLVYGFASLVTAFAGSFTPEERLPLIYFLVLFPIVVLAVFAWLVSAHSGKLFAPADFKNEENFVRSAGIPYGLAGIDDQSHIKAASTAPSISLVARATGSFFWLGHDLMWTADVLLREGPQKEISIGLTQARHHLVQVGLEGTPIDVELIALRELVQQSEELSLSPSVRDKYASQIGSIIDRIGITAEASQGNFKVPPYWKRIRA